jgi:MobA/MobL family
MAGFGRVSHGGVNGDYYGREKECLMAIDKNGNNEVNLITSNWQRITLDETLGNKEKGIRGRHDARVGTNIILSMPNEFSPEECLETIKSIISETLAADCYWSAWVHEGKKNGIENRHVHLSINERVISTGKKDRVMQKKGWFQNVFMTIYRKKLKKPFENVQKQLPRQRLSMELVQLDPFYFQEQLKALNQPKRNFYIQKSKDDYSWNIYEKNESYDKGYLPAAIVDGRTGQFSISARYHFRGQLSEIKEMLKSDAPELFEKIEKFESQKISEDANKNMSKGFSR